MHYPGTCGRGTMKSIYNVAKAPVGWSVFCEGVRLAGIYGAKETALEAATLAGSLAVRAGHGIQINVPEDLATSTASTSETARLPQLDALMK
ncbi:MAG: hypothetical protein NVS1B11_37770 [Terriglobales bacterium]